MHLHSKRHWERRWQDLASLLHIITLNNPFNSKGKVLTALTGLRGGSHGWAECWFTSSWKTKMWPPPWSVQACQLHQIILNWAIKTTDMILPGTLSVVTELPPEATCRIWFNYPHDFQTFYVSTHLILQIKISENKCEEHFTEIIWLAVR